MASHDDAPDHVEFMNFPPALQQELYEFLAPKFKTVGEMLSFLSAFQGATIELQERLAKSSEEESRNLVVLLGGTIKNCYEAIRKARARGKAAGSAIPVLVEPCSVCGGVHGNGECPDPNE
jgi:hypothetical protein